MGTVKRPYGPWSKEMLEGCRQAGVLKVEALVEWLASRGTTVDRTLVSHWGAGRSHLPADVLPLLAEFTERPELVFGPYLHAVNCYVYHVPDHAADGTELTDLMLEAGGCLGRVQHTLAEARSPDSPGGVAITDEEREELADRLNELIHHLAEVRAGLMPAKKKRRR
jgi:hypothetical protein